MYSYKRPPDSEPENSMDDINFDKNIPLHRKGFCLGLPSSLLLCLLGFSVTLNIILVSSPLTNIVHNSVKEQERSLYAGLSRSVPRQWRLFYKAQSDDVEYFGAEWDDVWRNTNYNPGVIALDDDYAKSMNLPRSQRWPWDHSKGIYLLNAYHNLHCLKNLQIALEQYHRGENVTIKWAHTQHCLLALRDEIMCNADDTPRYTGFQRPRASGFGQYRTCRDWDALERWAKDGQRAGCWKHLADNGVAKPETVDNYRFCPDDSPYKIVSLARDGDEKFSE